MVPMPENLESDLNLEGARELYMQMAKSHNKILTDYLKLKDQYDWMQRQVFGSKSERIVLTPDEQQSLFSAGDIQNTGGFEVTDKLLLDPGHRVKTHLRTTIPAGHGKGALPESLPRVDIHVPLTDAQLAEVKNNSLILVREDFNAL